MAYLVIAVVVLAFLYFHHRQSRDWQKERALLISRIQTPEIATSLVPTPKPPPASQTYDEGQEYRALVHGENGAE